MDRLELCNKIRMDIRDESAREFPIDAFPKKIKKRVRIDNVVKKIERQTIMDAELPLI